MGKYLFENIRVIYPDARYTLVVSSRVDMIRDLFATYSWLKVIEVNRNLHSLIAFFGRGRSDVVVTPYTGGVFPLAPKCIARLIARTLVGYTDRSKFNRFLYDKLIPLVGRARAPRLLETDVLAALDVPVSVPYPTFTYSPQMYLLERLWLQEKGYVILHLFSGSDMRGLSFEMKHRLISMLRTTLSVPLVLTGTRKETESLGELPDGVRIAHTNVQELAHLIDHSAGIVSLDTGVAHIAAHLRKPLVVLASCVGVQWWSPAMYGKDTPYTLFTRRDVCTGGHEYRGSAKCLDAIDSAEVAKAVAQLIPQ